MNFDEIFFTDDGATINGLKAGGLQLSKGRNEHLQRILDQFGVKLDGNEITAKAESIRDFALKKHMLLQAMIRVNDMFFMSRSRVASLFLDDIQDFFLQKDIYYSESVQFIGTSGLTHNYDFLMQRTKTKPERLCRAVNHPDRNSVSSILFAWNDTKAKRRSDAQLVVILNDQNRVGRGIEDAFENYQAKVILWSERNSPEIISYLSA